MKKGRLPKPAADKPRKSIVTLAVWHTLPTKKALAVLLLGEIKTRGTSAVSKVRVRSVDFE